MKRPLTAEEIENISSEPWLKSQPLPIKNTAIFALKALLWLELLLGLPIAVLFFAAAYWGHSYDLFAALTKGAIGLTVPPGLIVVLAVGGAISKFLRPTRDWRSTVLDDLKLGIGKVTTLRPIAAHPLMDGDNSVPYMLLQLKNDKWMCISDLDWKEHFDEFTPTDTIVLCTLPNAKVTVSICFSGHPIPIKQTIHTDNIWRHDDLPFDEPFPKKSMPDELLKQLYHE